MTQVDVSRTLVVDGESVSINAQLTEDPPHGAHRHPRLIHNGRAYGPNDILIRGKKGSLFTARQFVHDHPSGRDNAMMHAF